MLALQPGVLASKPGGQGEASKQAPSLSSPPHIVAVIGLLGSGAGSHLQILWKLAYHM